MAWSGFTLKNETTLPTRTTKDRMATVALAYLHDRGVRHFTASSTGNSSSSLAYRIRAYPDMHLYLFSGEAFASRVNYAAHPQVTHFGLRGASFVEAGAYAGKYAAEHGLVSEGGFFNPGRREGLKLAFLEASEQVPVPIDWYVQAVSSAMGVYGVFKAARELRQLGRIDRLPRLLCVQQESCAPMANAFGARSETIEPRHRVARPSGIAEAILRGDPTNTYPYIRRIVLESEGDFVAASEADIRTARTQIEALEGINVCFSASAAIAGLTRFAREHPELREQVVLVNLTGADRPPPAGNSVHWLERNDQGWTAPPPHLN